MYFCTGSGFIFHPSCPSPISALFIIGNFSLFLIFSSSFFFHHSRRRGFLWFLGDFFIAYFIGSGQQG